jgi:hypothetical protein
MNTIERFALWVGRPNVTTGVLIALAIYGFVILCLASVLAPTGGMML